MHTEEEKRPLKWYHLRRVRLTREYLAGVIAGFGIGVSLMAVVFTPFVGYYLLYLVGLGIVGIGSGLALQAQGRYTEH
jgi:F0F1-type ATP synthase assembly protein I